MARTECKISGGYGNDFQSRNPFQMMVSESNFARGLIGVAIAVLLAINPLLLPGSLPVSLTYHVTATEIQPNTSIAVAAANQDDGHTVIECLTGTIPPTRSCLFERRVGPNGTFIINSPGVRGAIDSNRSNYQYVRLRGELYDPRVARRNSSIVLSLTRVAPVTVAQQYAYPLSYVPEGVKDAINSGKANTTVPAPSRDEQIPTHAEQMRQFYNAIVRANGQYYAVKAGANSPHPDPTVALHRSACARCTSWPRNDALGCKYRL